MTEILDNTLSVDLTSLIYLSRPVLYLKEIQVYNIDFNRLISNKMR